MATKKPKVEKFTKTMVPHTVTMPVIEELTRRGFKVVQRADIQCGEDRNGLPRYAIEANVHSNRLETIKREVEASLPKVDAWAAKTIGKLAPARTVDEIVKPRPVISVEDEGNKVMTTVLASVEGVKRVIWRTTTRAGAHAVADFLDANPSVARKAWDMDGSGK